MKLKQVLNCDCPKCGDTKSLRKVIWGMPSQEPDPKKYVLGGCCLPEVLHELECISCGWNGDIAEI
jgi:hypothetical protein